MLIIAIYVSFIFWGETKPSTTHSSHSMACQESADFTNVFNFHHKIERLVMKKLYVLSKLSQLTMDGFASNWDEKKALSHWGN